MKELFPQIPYLQGERVVLRKICGHNAEALSELTRSEKVYRYLPTFLYEQKYDDIHYVIRHLYDECLEESLILGVFMEEQFCGLVELYGYRAQIHKISTGYRFLERFWGRGIATEVMKLITDYLARETDVEIITASTMVENRASANVLKKTGFFLVNSGVGEDWGYDHPTIADKWVL